MPGVPAQIRTGHRPNTGLEPYRYANPLDEGIDKRQKEDMKNEGNRASMNRNNEPKKNRNGDKEGSE
jgi:hypothetical protein